MLSPLNMAPDAGGTSSKRGDSTRAGDGLGGPASDTLLVVPALSPVALNGLFVAAEFGLVKVRSPQVDGLVRGYMRPPGLLRKTTGKLDACLSVFQPNAARRPVERDVRNFHNRNARWQAWICC